MARAAGQPLPAGFFAGEPPNRFSFDIVLPLRVRVSSSLGRAAMSFGKRNAGHHQNDPAPVVRYRDVTLPPAGRSAALSRMLVLAVVGLVAFGGLSALLAGLLGWGRAEPVQVDAALIDGSSHPSVDQGRVVDMCTQHGFMAATRGAPGREAERAKVEQACACAIEATAAELSPLQMSMLYVDYRTRLRATLADIDRTGERFDVGAVPRLEMREGAAVALVAADRYEGHWRAARDRVAEQARRCQGLRRSP
jgi:hypothetical protein